jgi:hypothetical protein
MFQDTIMAMTLIGYRASPGGRHTDGTVQSEELQAPMMRRANAGHGPHCRARMAPGTYRPTGR